MVVFIYITAFTPSLILESLFLSITMFNTSFDLNVIAVCVLTSLCMCVLGEKGVLLLSETLCATMYLYENAIQKKSHAFASGQ